ncbi:CBS/PB1 domain-containing protein [Sugiyamaella lignohabitans]|uniref:CBS/PB1 domain-containing protein n=1 Tax=Sugiyamaella lignohabitans TaxID=796027 RepID=A0A167C8L6_9ASCO|nr:CBS/PB1 domain-containing protein [Sugiyamaella lignohabitans]ANB11359.1 CBS/PB1 domain-containing protein [Sugiyamaella lignohabitans]
MPAPVNTPAKKGGSTSASSVVSASSTAITSPMPSQDPLTERRKRQTKRDEAIRKKLETEINKRRNQVGKTRAPRRRPAGSVLALKPSPPLTMKFSTSIHEAAQFMSAKRENCVLVLDDDESICGIFTAKDLAFKVVGSGLDAKSMTIENIMTKNPLCANTDTSATDALNLMVSRGFRHLPVMDENHDIAGVLDITKCFFEAMEKLERAYQSSRKLHDALEGVQSELGSSQPAQIISYVEALKQQTEGPDLESILSTSASPVFVDVKTNVSEAAALMKENHTTAVLVTDQNSITGIFTSKDVVLRVIAAGLDPKTCSVVRVMTPQPDFAPKSMTIQAALRKMHEGHYLNLPVMGDDNEVVGIVDVLKLTYATLEQINNMNGVGNDGSEGPAWNRFWMSLDNDSESVHSDSHSNRPITPMSSRRSGQFPELDESLPPSSPPEVSQSELAQFNIAELGPNDSISRLGASRQQSGLADEDLLLAPFPFKFKSPSGRVHRVTISADSGISYLRQAIIDKFNASEIESLGGAGLVEDDKLVEVGFAVSYIDDEGDAVAITTTQDLVDAINISRICGFDKADLYVHHPDTQVEPTKSTAKSSRRSLGATPEDGDVLDETTPLRRKEKTPIATSTEVIPGVPNELLLPGAIVTLAVSIVLVFSFARR